MPCPHTSSRCPFFTSPLLSACPPPPLPHICLLFSLCDIPLQWAGLPAFLWPFSQKEKQLWSRLYLCELLKPQFAFSALVLIHMLVMFIVCRAKLLVQKKTVLWPRCRWRITKVKMMTVHFNKVETYVSGNSTGLVLILLCKASMYSSMKGHCRKSRRKEVKTTRTHMHDDSAPGEYQNDLKTTETNNSSNQPLGFITFKDSTRKLLCQTLWQTALPLKSH